jgi:hypothetical protein
MVIHAHDRTTTHLEFDLINRDWPVAPRTNPTSLLLMRVENPRDN